MFPSDSVLKNEPVPDRILTPINYVYFCSFTLAQRKKTKASVALMKVFPNELENQKDFDSFTEWLQTFELYRGKQGEEGFQDEARVVGQFKVSP